MGRKKIKDRKKVEITSIYAITSKCFGVKSYRGFAPLAVLSRMSMADVYHPGKNPTGTQRDLSPKHAREAYEYARDCRNKQDALWPEVILNIRNAKVLRVTRKAPAKGPKDVALNLVKIQIDWEKINSCKETHEVAISRVDGNHRLYYAGGEFRKKQFPPLDNVYSPFCITEGITTDDEKKIFMTINRQQKKLNVTHLLRLQEQLSTENELWLKSKDLWIVKKLGDDLSSPFYKRIYKGGKKEKGDIYLIREKSLLDGVSQILQNFVHQSNIKDRNVLLNIVINFYNAIKSVWPNEWMDKKKYKLMTSTGLQALGAVGGKLMTILYTAKSLKETDFKVKLMPLKREFPDFWDSKSEYMAGRTGRPGAEKIAEEIMEVISVIDDRDLEV